MEFVENGQDIYLPNSDPAVTTVRGYKRFMVGLDIAQGVDRTAYTIIRDERYPRYSDTGHQELGPRKRTVVTAAHIPPMSYDHLAQVTRNLMKDPNIAGRAYLAVDASGVGRAFCDILNTKSVLHTRVQMTGGDADNEVRERDVRFNNVGKVRLLSAINSAFHTGELTLGEFEARDLLLQELESFEADISKGGRMTIDGGTDFGHADIAVSAALAFYLSDHRSVGAAIGETMLAGYW